MRSILVNNDLFDGWAFWGYGLHQHPIIVNRLIHTILGEEGSNRSCTDWSNRRPLRLLAEHHYSRHSLEAILGHFGPFSPLQRVASQCHCRVVLATRLREPLSFYTSFYRWTVNWRQQRNGTAFGKDMLEWAPKNLQSTLLLNPLDATWAEFTGVHTPEGRMRRRIFSQFDEGSLASPAGQTAFRRRQELRRVIASFDLVGLVERFDETLLLLSDLLGLQRLLYTRSVPSSTNPHYKQPSIAQTCPDRAKCEAKIGEVAPIDHQLYREASTAFDAKVKALGAPFSARLRAFRRANADYQALLKRREEQAGKEPDGTARQPYRRVIERIVAAPTEMHFKVPMSRLRCFLGEGAIGVEACQRVYADTPFRYNWRHTPSSCCSRLMHCTRLRLQHRRMPQVCRKWLPAVADPEDTLGTSAHARAQRNARINASLPSLCREECAPPEVMERSLGVQLRVPSPDEIGALPLPRSLLAALEMLAVGGSGSREARERQQQLLLGGASIVAPPLAARATTARATTAAAIAAAATACNDSSTEEVAGKPWLDFTSCAREGETRENLNSGFGACAHELWMRVNCRRTCGTCDMSLRQVLSLKPRHALMAARAAARARHSKVLRDLLIEEAAKKAASKADKRQARRRGKAKGMGGRRAKAKGNGGRGQGVARQLSLLERRRRSLGIDA